MILGLIATILIGKLCGGSALDNGVGQLPPMGYSNWYDTKCDVHADRFIEAADALQKSGLQMLGYSFINIDAGAFVGRDASGKLIPDLRFFPHGLRNLSDELHRRVLPQLSRYARRRACRSGLSFL